MEHKKIISSFLKYLNKITDDYILKGGTSLMTCYKLTRFSENIDLDSTNKTKINQIIDNFCKEKGFSYRIAKETDTTKRFFIHYNDKQNKSLKVEISYRKRTISENEHTKINGINVYNINEICMMKANAYNSRDKIRDLYDLTFICNNYLENLSEPVKNMVQNTIEYKGLEQFDYLINTQSDELIDKDKLAEDFLTMYEKLGLLVNKDETTLESFKDLTLENLIDDAKEIATHLSNKNPQIDKSIK